MYDVKVYQEGCGELVVAEVDVEDSADPDMIPARGLRHKAGLVSERDIKVLLTVRTYDAEPDEVLRKLAKAPNDIEWYSTRNGEFEILSAELAEGQ